MIADDGIGIFKKIKEHAASIAKAVPDAVESTIEKAASAEETEEGVWGKALISLSEQRAEFVKNNLVKLGINSSRLSVEGKGGTEPVADRKDTNVNWKNRRVEFILEK